MPAQTETRVSTRLAYAVILGAATLAAFGLLLVNRKTEQSVRPPDQIAPASVPSWCPTRCGTRFPGDSVQTQYTIIEGGITRTVTVYESEDVWDSCIADPGREMHSCESSTNRGSDSCSQVVTYCNVGGCRFTSCGSGSGPSGAAVTAPTTSLQEIDRFRAD